MPTASLTTSISDAQLEMRLAYFGGAPGMLTSALVWMTAGFVALRQTPERAVWALFIGGMLIHPLSVVLTKALGRSGTHGPHNPLGTLALATTFWMILCLPLAYGVSLHRIEWFFPAMLLVIGGRYLTFSTVFGTRIYWLCGGTLALAGYAAAAAKASPVIGAFAGAAIEAAFALVIFVRARRAPGVAKLHA
ncbi:hypothetical protein [Gemmatimonas sp.]|uniref:DUF7010 family protein n=1 Tax=Gemmatimonas sp. TaxID=1962908 RepID=UPI00286E2284|nr:hypothetical protein [Gemmatimonas sp.]